MIEQKIDSLISSIDRLSDLVAAQLAQGVPTTALRASAQPEKVDEPQVEADVEAEDAPKKRRGRPKIQPKVEEPAPKVEKDTPVETDPVDLDDEDDDEDDVFASTPVAKKTVKVTESMLKEKLIEVRDNKGKQALGDLMKSYKVKHFSEIEEADFAAIYADAEKLLDE
jgi:hypothetical protein